MTLTFSRIAFIAFLCLSILFPALIPTASYATKYGAGSYGRCQYQTCAVSLASSTTVNVGVIPATGTTRCTVAKDSVTVTTSSSTGYILSLIDNDSTTTLVSGANTIPSTAGTYASPVVLAANTWGYRVDGQGNFGAGPTSAIASAAIPTSTYAKIQPSTGTADTLINATTAATNGATTSVWYGVCVNTTQPTGTYVDSVLYTALVN